MKEMLIEVEGLNKQGVSDRIMKSGGSSALANPLWDVSGENDVSEMINRYIDNRSIMSEKKQILAYTFCTFDLSSQHI